MRIGISILRHARHIATSCGTSQQFVPVCKLCWLREEISIEACLKRTQDLVTWVYMLCKDANTCRKFGWALQTKRPRFRGLWWACKQWEGLESMHQTLPENQVPYWQSWEIEELEAWRTCLWYQEVRMMQSITWSRGRKAAGLLLVDCNNIKEWLMILRNLFKFLGMYYYTKMVYGQM